MNRDKQIEEMANAIEQARIKATDTTNSMNYGFGGWYAKELYAKGYRKASDVAEEIFEEIEHLMHRYCNEPYYTSGEMAYDIAELKKKYESEKDNG